ncbi:cation:proton antiporter [Roseibacterium sp. SDUM158017]|uniref:cation:proton antiporter domain-containing protein n=1 Tax=Roseicyclus salinarum TaxID=3036773 RepID=UPI002415964D|nr:cation:proton antiporter [Roseibacterium sp. SDUM158017]MDG4647386.1 cation:proton antiporter [Roseibacterium sp. SDUM158017]
MEQLNVTVAITGAVVLCLGLLSTRIDRASMSAPLVALVIGILCGPFGAGWIMPASWPNSETVLKEAARFTLAISVFGIAMRTPVQSYRRLVRPVAVLLSLGMVTMWAVSGALGWALLGLPPLAAMALGAALAPTDPVVASSIVTGKMAERALPDRLRSTLSLESGANDGLGYLLVLLPVQFTRHDPARAWEAWFVDTLVIGVLAAVAAGAVLGWLSALALETAARRRWAEKHSQLSMTVALSLTVLAAVKLLGSDGILAAFAAGAAFNMTASRRHEREEENVQEAISKLFNLPVFVILGAALPVGGWVALGWQGVALAILMLALRRPVALMVCGPFLGPGITRADRIFLGWFGPVGVAALYYALHLTELTGEVAIWHAASLVIVASVLAHGLSSAVGLSLYPTPSDTRTAFLSAISSGSAPCSCMIR